MLTHHGPGLASRMWLVGGEHCVPQLLCPRTATSRGSFLGGILVPCTAGSRTQVTYLDNFQHCQASSTPEPLLWLAQADTPDIILFPGDLSYADDYNLIDTFGYQPRWDEWGRLTQQAFATVPLVTGIGPPAS